MGIETPLVVGLAAMLDAAGIGTWSTTVPYLPTEVGIHDGPIAPETPEGIGLATYTVADAVDSRSIIGVQFTFRSATRAGLRDRAEATFDLFHARWGHQLAGVRIDQMLRQSSTDLGIDEAGLLLRSDNYYVTVNHPTANRP